MISLVNRQHSTWCENKPTRHTNFANAPPQDPRDRCDSVHDRGDESRLSLRESLRGRNRLVSQTFAERKATIADAKHLLRDFNGVVLDHDQSLHTGTTVDGGTCVDDKMLGPLDDPIVVRVTTQHGESTIPTYVADLFQDAADLAANEKRSPVVIGGSAFVPASFTKWWHVRDNQHVGRIRRHVVQLCFEPSGRIRPQLSQQFFPMARVLGAKVLNHRKVVQTHLRAFIVALDAITPAVFADQIRIVSEVNRRGVGQVDQLVEFPRERDDRSSRCGDRILIEVVISEPKVDRSIKPLSATTKLKNDIVTFGDISGDDDALSPVRGDFVNPRFPSGHGNVVQMRISGPNQTLRHQNLVIFRAISRRELAPGSFVLYRKNRVLAHGG